MNELIETIFNNFSVNGVQIPVVYLYYDGHGEPYVTYMQMDAYGEFRGDDELLGYIDYYDFDVYAKGNYTAIIESLITLLESNGFIYKPSRNSPDMYETDTGYYHKTLNFAFYREV